jgi:hypothetical protein
VIPNGRVRRRMHPARLPCRALVNALLVIKPSRVETFGRHSALLFRSEAALRTLGQLKQRSSMSLRVEQQELRREDSISPWQLEAGFLAA